MPIRRKSRLGPRASVTRTPNPSALRCPSVMSMISTRILYFGFESYLISFDSHSNAMDPMCTLLPSILSSTCSVASEERSSYCRNHHGIPAYAFASDTMSLGWVSGSQLSCGGQIIPSHVDSLASCIHDCNVIPTFTSSFRTDAERQRPPDSEEALGMSLRSLERDQSVKS